MVVRPKARGGEMAKRLCGSCNGSGGTHREVKEVATGYVTKKWYPCSSCGGKGEK